MKLSDFERDISTPLRRDMSGLAAAKEDVGRIAKGSPLGVVQPRGTDELQQVIRAANHHGVKLTVRGAGYSQSGQSVADGRISLDTTRMDQIEVGTGWVRCGGGARLRAIARRTLTHGCLPNVLPLNLDMTLGGLLFAGGVGANSFRFGLVAASVQEMEVVTGEGACVRCSPRQNSELFHAVLGGLGRCGIIAKATLATRRARPRVRTFHVSYDRSDEWFNDLEQLADCEQVSYLEGFIWRKPASSQAHIQWSYSLQVGVAYEAMAPQWVDMAPDACAAQLLSDTDDDVDAHIERYAGRFRDMLDSGQWDQSHPWYETFVPLDSLRNILPEVLEHLPPELGDGHRVLLLNTTPDLPGIAQPSGTRCACFAVLPMGVSTSQLDVVLPVLGRVDERFQRAGAKRYLSGWIGQRDAVAWRQHFAEYHATWRQVKRTYDCKNVLGSWLLDRSDVCDWSRFRASQGSDDQGAPLPLKARWQ